MGTHTRIFPLTVLALILVLKSEGFATVITLQPDVLGDYKADGEGSNSSQAISQASVDVVPGVSPHLMSYTWLTPAYGSGPMGSGPIIVGYYFSESRFNMEFDISAIPSGLQIIDAQLSWVESVDYSFPATPPERYPEIVGYAGDGVLSPTDFSGGTVLYPAIGDGVVASASFDVTGFVNSLVVGNEGYAGFTVMQSLQENYWLGERYVVGDPVLVLTVVPEIPANGMLAMIAGLAFLRWRSPLRRRHAS